MPKLTDSQLVILSAAAQRNDRALLPLPKSVKLNKGAAALVLKSLVRQGLATEKPASPEDEVWREADGKRLTLAVTEAGLTAIGVDTTAKPDAARATRATDTKPKRKPAAGSKPAKPAKAKARTGKSSAGKRPETDTKQGRLIALLRRTGGATIEELTKATGWQPHSVRGAISGLIKKKLGLPVASETVAGRGRVYRIAAR
jgi:Protein of unknown function (DUF3489)